RRDLRPSRPCRPGGRRRPPAGTGAREPPAATTRAPRERSGCSDGDRVAQQLDRLDVEERGPEGVQRPSARHVDAEAGARPVVAHHEHDLLGAAAPEEPDFDAVVVPLRELDQVVVPVKCHLLSNELTVVALIHDMSERDVRPLAHRRLAVGAELVVAGEKAGQDAAAEEQRHHDGEADVHPLLVPGGQAAATARRSSSGRRNWPVQASGTPATPSGGPTAIPSPPASPPSGPRSTSQSACLITSRLCSITSTVFPESTSRCSTSSRRSMSAKWSPVVGSSRM